MIRHFNQINKADIVVAGGKGANLGELVSAGINVPNGFILTAEAYKSIIKENKIDSIIKEKLRDAGRDEKNLLSLAAELRALFKKAKFPKEIKELIQKAYAEMGENISVAIRSSATAEDLSDASFAGQQETYLNVQGIEDVLKQILNCYASLWTDRAVMYRLKQNYKQDDLAIAVIIQEMVESEKSGVLFTVNPINQNQEQMLIDANYGLGESVVSGSVTADNYIISKNGEILSFTIGSKEREVVYGDKQTKEIPVEESRRIARVLNDEEVLRLCQIAKKIEEHYAQPMDIEWAIKNQEIYILQARAITTLKKTPVATAEKIDSYVRGVKIKKYNRKIMSFMIEKIPFAFRAIEFDYFTAVTKQKNRIFAENGIILSPNLIMDNEGIMSIKREKASINWHIFKIFRTLFLLRDYTFCEDHSRDFIKDYVKKIENLKELDFEQMTLSDCKDFMIYAYELTEQISYERFKYAVFPSIVDRSLTRALKKVNPNYTSFDLYWGMNNRTSELERDLASMADYINHQKELKSSILSGLTYDEIGEEFSDFKKISETFLDKHGFKMDNISYCVEGKSFFEDKDRIIRILYPLLSEANTLNTKIESKDFNEIKKALQKIYGKNYPTLEKKMNSFRHFHYVREEGQYLYEIVFYYVRKCLKRINELLLGSDDYKEGVANLFHQELIEVLDSGHLDKTSLEKIKKRKNNIPLANKVWDASKFILYDNKGDVLKGISGNAGVVMGKARVIHDIKEFHKLQEGEVLVCPFTAPEWTPLFKLASAVVADTGSALSHAAIVAREFGIPAVLGVGFGTTRFKDGDLIKVDGDRGEVSLRIKKN